MTMTEFSIYMGKCKVPKEFQQIVKEYKQVFGQTLTEIGIIKGEKAEFKVQLIAKYNKERRRWEEPTAWFTEPYKLDLERREIVQKAIKEELEAGIIEECNDCGKWKSGVQ